MRNENLDHDPKFWVMVLILLPFGLAATIGLKVREWRLRHG